MEKRLITMTKQVGSSTFYRTLSTLQLLVLRINFEMLKSLTHPVTRNATEREDKHHGPTKRDHQR